MAYFAARKSVQTKGEALFEGLGFGRCTQRSFRAIACVGYALLLHVCQLTLWGGLLLSSRVAFGVLDLIRLWSVPLCAAIALACVGVSLASHRLPSRFSASALAGTAVVSCAAMVSGYLVAVWTGGVVALVCVGAALLGVGLALAFSAWCSSFSRMGLEGATETALLSVVLGSALSLASSFLSMEALEASFFVAAVLSSVLLIICCKRGPAVAPDCEGVSEGRAGVGRASLKGALESVRKPLPCACAIAFAVAITRMMSLTAAPGMSVSIGMLGVLLAGLAAVVLLAMRKKGETRIGIPSLFQVLFPVVATLLLVMSAAGPLVAVLVGSAVFAIHSTMFALVMPACIEGASKSCARPLTVYGLFAGMVYALFALATWLGVSLFAGGDAGASVSLVAVLLVFYVLAMANAMMQRRSGRDGAARFDGRDGVDVAVADAGGVVAVGAAADASGAAAGGISANGVSATGVAAGGGAEAAAAGGVGVAPVAGGANPAGPVDATPGVRTEDAGTAGEDPIERRCLAVARAYGLSPRETDVLVAFAHGRNVAYLAEHLVLSANTIRSHSKTLYAKLGVHSKQELIDLVERQEDVK